LLRAYLDAVNLLAWRMTQRNAVCEAAEKLSATGDQTLIWQVA
jgi:hypothetical protein